MVYYLWFLIYGLLFMDVTYGYYLWILLMVIIYGHHLWFIIHGYYLWLLFMKIVSILAIVAHNHLNY